MKNRVVLHRWMLFLMVVLVIGTITITVYLRGGDRIHLLKSTSFNVQDYYGSAYASEDPNHTPTTVQEAYDYNITTDIPHRKTSDPRSIPSYNSLKGLKNVFSTPERKWNSSRIMFLKTHKTSSTTIQSIIIRYGLRKNLTFVLPKGSKKELGWPKPFSKSRHMRDIQQEYPDILCYHAVLSNDIIKVMPNDSFYVTSVRDPYKQFMSAYKFYNLETCLRKRNKTFDDVIDGKITSCGGGIFKNAQMHDLGMPTRLMSDERVVRERINYLDKLFHLVMIVEYFDESIILLRDLLGLTNPDVLYFKSNFRTPEVKEVDKEKLPDKVDTLLKADILLYNHFKKKMEIMIASKKKYLTSEIKKFKSLQEEYANFCIKETLPASAIRDSRFKPFVKEAYGYALTEQGLRNQTCLDLVTVEPYFIRLLSERQHFGFVDKGRD